MKRALFICSANKIRSPTAEQVFSTWPDIETDSAGLDHAATIVLSTEQIEWAGLIVGMGRSHRDRLSKEYKVQLKGKKVICLNIPDDFVVMQPELIAVLKARVGPHLR